MEEKKGIFGKLKRRVEEGNKRQHFFGELPKGGWNGQKNCATVPTSAFLQP
jgi:hypothetical protein